MGFGFSVLRVRVTRPTAGRVYRFQYPAARLAQAEGLPRRMQTLERTVSKQMAGGCCLYTTGWKDHNRCPSSGALPSTNIKAQKGPKSSEGASKIAFVLKVACAVCMFYGESKLCFEKLSRNFLDFACTNQSRSQTDRCPSFHQPFNPEPVSQHT